jgi:hypothetical protein
MPARKHEKMPARVGLCQREEVLGEPLAVDAAMLPSPVFLSWCGTSRSVMMTRPLKRKKKKQREGKKKKRWKTKK